MSYFTFPIETPIANDRIKLIAFEPDLHSLHFVAQINANPELLAHMPSGPFGSVNDFKALLLEPSNSLFSMPNPAHYLFAVIDKTKASSPEDEEGELAGTIAYIGASKRDMSAEIGFITIFPKYQKTHVATNAVGLLLENAYSSPERGGLGLVRTEWRCNSINLASIRVAERMGYEKVGIIPYHMCFPKGRKEGKANNGKPPPPGSDPDDLWRDTLIYTMTWERWNEVGGVIAELMNR